MSASQRMFGGFLAFGVLLIVGGIVQNSGPTWLPWAFIGPSLLSFVYAMYVFYFDVTKGDAHLQKQGIRGSAVVLSAKQTGAIAQTGQFNFEAPYIWKYKLRVTIPGKAPYETSCGIARDDISQGETVAVAVSRFNRRSVAILTYKRA